CLLCPGVRERAETSGCGKTQWFTGLTHYESLTSSGQKRSYSVHLPWGYDSKHQYPVVFGFHGSDSVGFFFEADTKLSESRFSGNKIMVYPSGKNGSGLGLHEDLTFVDDLLAEVRANYCVDSSRIYATGMSNGGGFIGALACNTSVGAQFAAFAPAAGAFYTDLNGPDNGCAPARSLVPILEFHGGSDKSVAYAGGQGSGGVLPNISAWLGSWAQRNGCASAARVDDSNEGQVHHFSWTCQGIEGAMEHYLVDTMGHVWPSTEINFSQLSVPELPTYIQASELIMKFFDRFSL
ncbi:carbohydrate esterase family 1 protein, partial [Auriculariales sp. MPI-PUGE-AT-0066]